MPAALLHAGSASSHHAEQTELGFRFFPSLSITFTRSSPPLGPPPGPLPASSPRPGLLVWQGVLLHDGREPQQGALLEQVELCRGLAVDLQRGGVQAGPVGVLEAVPAQLSAGKEGVGEAFRGTRCLGDGVGTPVAGLSPTPAPGPQVPLTNPARGGARAQTQRETLSVASEECSCCQAASPQPASSPLGRAVGLHGLSLRPHPRAVLGQPPGSLQGGQGLRQTQDHHAEQCLSQGTPPTPTF